MIRPLARHIVIDAARSLSQHRLRTSLATLGIVIGVAALSAVLAVGDGIEAYVRAQLERTTSLSMVILQPRSHRTVGEQRIPLRAEDRFVLPTDDVAALAADVGNLRGAASLHRTFAEVDVGDGGARPVALMGVSGGATGMGGSELVAGRDVSVDDVTARRPVALVNDLVFEGDDEVLGRTLLVEGTTIEVIGRIEADRDGPLVAVPISVSASLDIDAGDRAIAIAVFELDRMERSEETIAAMEDWLDERHAGWRDGAVLQANMARLEQAKQGILLFKAFMGSITGIALLVGGIGIMNVLLVSVVERTREIGVRRAVGARAADIRLQLLTESVLLCAGGSGLGAAVGIAGAYLATFVMREMSAADVYAAVTASSIAFAVVTATVVGLVFGIVPAARAAKLSPVEAMRQD